jgi:hypothetical protein
MLDTPAKDMIFYPFHQNQMEMIEDLDGEMIGDFDEERCQLYIYVN